MPADPTILGYLGMKGVIDLRVADILAKQTLMQQKFSASESLRAAKAADAATRYTSGVMVAGGLVGKHIPSTSGWYNSSGYSPLSRGKYLPLSDAYPKLMISTMNEVAWVVIPGISFRARAELIDFI